MFRKLVKFSFSYSVIEGIQKGILFLLVPVFVSYMSSEEYGVVSTVLMVVPFVSLIVSLLLNASVNRYYFKYCDDEKKLKEFLGSVFIFLFLYSFSVGGSAILFGKKIFAFIMEGLAFNPYVVYAIIIAVLQPIVLAYFDLLKAIQDIKKYLVVYNIYFILQLVMLFLFIVVFKLKHDGYLLSLIIANIVGVVIIVVNLRNKVSFVLNWKYVKEALTYSFPIIPVDGVSLVNSLVDRYYILHFIGLASVGVYYIGLQISSIIALIVLAINSAYVPMFFKEYEKKVKSFEKIYRMGDAIIYFTSVLAAGTVILFDDFVNVLFDKEYSGAKDVLLYLCFLSSMKSIYFLNTNVLSLELSLVRMKTVAILIGATVNMLIGYYMTKYYGIVGASISTLIGFTLTTILLVCIVERKTLFKFTYSKHFTYWGVLFIVSYLIGYIDFDSIVLRVLIKGSVLLLVVVCLLFMFEFGYIKKKYHEFVGIHK